MKLTLFLLYYNINIRKHSCNTQITWSICLTNRKNFLEFCPKAIFEPVLNRQPQASHVNQCSLLHSRLRSHQESHKESCYGKPLPLLKLFLCELFLQNLYVDLLLKMSVVGSLHSHNFRFFSVFINWNQVFSQE